MGIQIVHYKNNLFCIRVHDISEVFYFFCPVNSRPVFPDADMMLSRKWFYSTLVQWFLLFQCLSFYC